MKALTNLHYLPVLFYFILFLIFSIEKEVWKGKKKKYIRILGLISKIIDC